MRVRILKGDYGWSYVFNGILMCLVKAFHSALEHGAILMSLLFRKLCNWYVVERLFGKHKGRLPVVLGLGPAGLVREQSGEEVRSGSRVAEEEDVAAL